MQAECVAGDTFRPGGGGHRNLVCSTEELILAFEIPEK